MANFELAFAHVLENEGTDYVNNPLDRGGPTRFGITWRTLADYRGVAVRPVDVENLDVHEAEEIYRQKYWGPVCGQLLTSQVQATALFDAAVLCGSHQAVLFAQEATGTDMDGNLGPVTRAALEAQAKSTRGVFLARFLKAQQAHFLYIVGRNPSQMPFLKGWLSRGLRLLLLT